jgi:uncharacterized protein YdhG (YjbR/CyaY superfamily)
MRKSDTIDEYIAACAAEAQPVLEQIRAVIKSEAPHAIECMRYAIPTFSTTGGHLVHFAAFKNHIGFYATPTGHAAFKEELSSYKQGKGSVQFPLDKPMPLDLIRRIVAFRVQEQNI